MKTTAFIAALAVSLLALTPRTTLAQSDIEKIGQIKMVSINKLQIVANNDEYLANITVTFINNSTNAIKLKDGRFDTSLASTNSQIDAGPAVLSELVIPAARPGAGGGFFGHGTAATPGLVEQVISVDLGARNPETMEKIIKLVNLMGDTSADMNMNLKGTTQIGVQINDGWVFRGNDSYTVELKFVPTVKREVLFR